MKPTSEAEMVSSPRCRCRRVFCRATKPVARLMLLPAPLLAEQEGLAVEDGDAAVPERRGDAAAPGLFRRGGRDGERVDKGRVEHPARRRRWPRCCRSSHSSFSSRDSSSSLAAASFFLVSSPAGTNLPRLPPPHEPPAAAVPARQRAVAPARNQGLPGSPGAEGDGGGERAGVRPREPARGEEEEALLGLAAAAFFFLRRRNRQSRDRGLDERDFSSRLFFPFFASYACDPVCPRKVQQRDSAAVVGDRQRPPVERDRQGRDLVVKGADDDRRRARRSALLA